jgi:TPR repeat protein
MDEETIKATYEIAENYFVGRNGYIRNYTKAAQLFQKLANNDHMISKSMLGMCYFKGQGVKMDRKKARELFQSSKNVDLSDYVLAAMDYFGIETKK